MVTDNPPRKANRVTFSATSGRMWNPSLTPCVLLGLPCQELVALSDIRLKYPLMKYLICTVLLFVTIGEMDAQNTTTPDHVLHQRR